MGNHKEERLKPEAAYHFRIEGEPQSIERYGSGHINITYLLTATSGKRYILQRINDLAFDVPLLMENIAAVIEVLNRNTTDPRGCMSIVPDLDGNSYYTDDSGYYRVYDFVEGSICLQTAETPDDFYQSAIGFGSFQRLMSEFPANELHETIPDFHNTIKRYSRFKEVVDQDVCGRAKYVLKEIEFVLQREQLAGQLQVRRETGELPVRVTHNDTKLNNVLLDEKTRKALCVIDLDTVMPGLAAYDFGDSIRFGATTAAEDEQDLNKVTIDVELFRIYTRGYLESFPEFTDAEIDSLPLGALIMTLECGVRFLTDYLEGDRYFAIHREHHNLDRARTQFHLVSEMEKKFDEMCRIVKEEANVIRGESMERYGIEVKVKNRPKLDDSFIPIQLFNQSFLKTAKKPVSIAIERTNGDIAAANTFIHGTPEMQEADNYYINRLVKTMLWMKGGYRIYVAGDDETMLYLKNTFIDGGEQEYDASFMSRIYEKPFEVVAVESIPEEKDSPKSVGGHLDGCRIGFDAGGSDRKVSAVIDGKSVFSEEVVWFPKTTADPDYHYEGITEALNAAAKHMPRVDAVGVSSAGIYINNKTMTASLFLQVPPDLYEEKVKDIYIRAITDIFGEIPYEVVNDGDVSALAGMMSLEEGNVLGIAMGTSEAAGYVDSCGCITGWLNEMAFVPVDVQPDAMRDEWSHDIGCGVKYFSQDAVVKLAPHAGIYLKEDLFPAEKLKLIQLMLDEGDARAADIYYTIGTYLGHTLAYYYDLYKFRHVLLLGRVMSGKGGAIIIEEARRVLEDEYPETASKILLHLPDEKFRRVGQSFAAASLCAIEKER